MTTPTTLYETELRIAARPQTVFDCLTKRELYQQWMGRDVTLEAREGGLFRVDVHGNVARGEYLTLEPPTRLVWSWGWEEDGHPLPPGASTVEITLRADGDGTVLRMVRAAGHTGSGGARGPARRRVPDGRLFERLPGRVRRKDAASGGRH